MSTHPAVPPHPAPMRIFQTLTGYQASFALKAAIDLNLFTAIAEGAATVPVLAGRLRCSERGIRILCDALTVLGFLAKEPAASSYSLAPDAAMFLDERSPAYIGGAAAFLLRDDLLHAFQQLTGAVRSGGTMLPGDGSVSEENPMWIDFARGMGSLMFPSAQEIAKAVVPQTGIPPTTILDIAAGHGLFGIAIAQHHPPARVTACDWPLVLEVAEENANRLGVANRFSKLPGNALTMDIGTGYDIVLLTNFLHHFDAETNIALLRKVRRAISPGGRAITLEFVPEPDRVSPPDAAFFSLVMLASTRSGDAYTFAELQSMLAAAGFGRTEQHKLESSPGTVLVSYES